MKTGWPGEVTDGPPLAMETDVAAFPDVDRAHRIDERAENVGDGASQAVTAQYRNGLRLATHEDHARLAPRSFAATNSYRNYRSSSQA